MAIGDETRDEKCQCPSVILKGISAVQSRSTSAYPSISAVQGAGTAYYSIVCSVFRVLTDPALHNFTAIK